LARKAARESIVLLKNDDDLLPLDEGKLKNVAVIGPNADLLESLVGNYNGVPSAWTTPLEGIRSKLGSGRDLKVTYALGTTLTGEALVPVPSHVLRELRGEFFDNRELQGKPVATRVDKEINFNWFTNAPVPQLPTDNFSARWEGKLAPATSGTYELGARADDGVRVFLDDKLLVENWRDGGARTVTKRVELEAGREYKLRIEYYERYANGELRLVWSPPNLAQDLRAEAVTKAKEADVVVMALGLSPQLEGEEMDVKLEGFRGGDRTKLELPKAQEELLKAVQATGKPVVLVLLSGSALAVNWANENVPAILQAWYPGEEGGAALADVLFGDYNPAGRLPVTFYKSADDLPPFTDYGLDGKTYRYFKGEPLYPFGHGLSFTRFKYTNLKFSSKKVKPSESVRVSVDVQNAGGRAGDEVVQLYVTDVAASVRVPVRSLRGVQRIHLMRGERRRVNFTLAPADLALIDERGRRVVEPGEFRVSVGGKQPGFTGHTDAQTTEVLTGGFTVGGEATEIP
jgi:beta-glucosidase